MGKGDQKTRRGKLFRGSYGVRRPRKREKEFHLITSPSVKKKPAAEKRAETGKKAAQSGTGGAVKASPSEGKETVKE